MQFSTSLALLNRFHSTRVLVLGDVMLDRFVYGSVERISPEAPIPVLNVEKHVDMPGGAANVARNIAALGAGVTLLSVAGDDLAAADLAKSLSESPSIDVRLLIEPSRPTTQKTRFVADGQQIMRADSETRVPLSSDFEIRLIAEFNRALADAAVVVLSDYAKGVLSDSVTRAVIDASRSANKIIIVDPKAKEFVRYRGANILTPNRHELQAACGGECATDGEIEVGARQLLNQGICDLLVVTRGRDGMSIIGAGTSAEHLPTVARQVFDVSGAGDTVVATIALALAAGGNIVQAASLANVAAGIVVGKRGTATVSTGEIMTLLTPNGPHADPRKIFVLESALQLARGWRDQGLSIAFANGCFDLLHPGHVSLLEQARRSADRLVVGLNSDESIRRLKGPNRPIQGEVARATVLAAMKSVDAVVIFSEDTPIRLIQALEPDVLVKGADYTVATVIGAEFVLSRGGKVVLAELLSGHSTSDTVKRVATCL
jgi:D-beta-D-heptose 7-phosphate kinase/D-beta-D-heptose 1-phosphate adenosyltransferase